MKKATVVVVDGPHKGRMGVIRTWRKLDRDPEMLFLIMFPKEGWPVMFKKSQVRIVE